MQIWILVRAKVGLVSEQYSIYNFETPVENLTVKEMFGMFGISYLSTVT